MRWRSVHLATRQCQCRCDAACECMARPPGGRGKADPAVDGGCISEPRCAAGACSGSSGAARNFWRAGSLRVAVFPCEGGRDEAGERALSAAFDNGGAERVTRLYLRDDLPEDQC
jgi:hypothetical protein